MSIGCLECRDARTPHPHRCPKCDGPLWQAAPAQCQDCNWNDGAQVGRVKITFTMPVPAGEDVRWIDARLRRWLAGHWPEGVEFGPVDLSVQAPRRRKKRGAA